MRQKALFRPQIRHHMMRLCWFINLFLFALAIGFGAYCLDNLR